MATSESSLCKITLLLIKDWDSFQIAMRGCLTPPGSLMPNRAAKGGRK